MNVLAAERMTTRTQGNLMSSGINLRREFRASAHDSESGGRVAAVVRWMRTVALSLFVLLGCGGQGGPSYRMYFMGFNVETLTAVSTESIASERQPFEVNTPDVMADLENVLEAALPAPESVGPFSDSVVRVRIDKIQDGHAEIWAVVDRDGHVLFDGELRWLDPEARGHISEIAWDLYQKQRK
jgi:hypothetical protein